MVSRERLELSTPGLKGPCSNQLSYRPTKSGYIYYNIKIVVLHYFLSFYDSVSRKVSFDYYSAQVVQRPKPLRLALA